jgi:hypothetical protein
MASDPVLDPAQSRFAFVVGAPRSGTTSLSGYLKGHPDVCFSLVKEPHFFSAQDLSGLADDELRRIVEEDYLARYFPHCTSDASLRMEGSVTYLYAADRMRAVLRMWPDSKFVIALRDPIELLPSLHRRLLYLGDETVEDFEQAWTLVPERRLGRSVPRTCVEPTWLDYEEIGRLGKHVERFFEIVGRERCFVAVYDDFASDPGGVYRRLLQFLGLPDDGQCEFVPHRTSLGFKIGWLQRLLKRPPKATRAILAGEKYRQRVKRLDGDKKEDPALARAILAGRRRLLDWNKAPAPPIQLSAELRRELRETLADDVALLSRLLGRDLSHWLGGTAPAAARPPEAFNPSRTALQDHALP